MILFIGILLIVGGLFRIYSQDGLWRITEWLNRTKGVASDRSDDWDMAQSIGGGVAIAVGLLLIILHFMGFNL